MAPRELFPGDIRAVTRRCVQRQFLLRPSPLVNRIVLYCLAKAAQKFSVQVHAFCVMSSHLHLVLTDPEVELPEFMHRLDLSIAKSMNAQLRRREAFWVDGSYGSTRLEDEEAVLSAIVYTLMNPVAAGLVPRGEEWPGLRSTPGDLAGRRIAAKKVGRYHSGGSRAPETAEFDIVRPPVCPDLSHAQLVELVRQRVEDEEAECREKMAAEKRRFLGRKRILVSTLTVSEGAIPPPAHGR